MKKIMDLIFEPVEDEKDEKIDIPEIMTRAKVTRQKKRETQTSSSRSQSKTEPVVLNEQVKDARTKLKENDVLSKPKASHISIDVTPKKAIRKVEYDKDYKYESQPALSPIFGVIESKGNHPKFTAPSITGTQATKSKIGTILSPIYGQIDNEKEEIKTSNVVIKEDKSNNDFTNYSLDDMLKEE